MTPDFPDTIIHPDDVPLPIVTFSRVVYVVVLSIAVLSDQPLWTTALWLLITPTIFLGARFNLIGIIGKKLFAGHLKGAEREDYRLVRFNNMIAVALLTAAQPAFLLGAHRTGMILTGLIVVACGAALAGFCVGCALYCRFKLYRYKFLGEH